MKTPAASFPNVLMGNNAAGALRYLLYFYCLEADTYFSTDRLS